MEQADYKTAYHLMFNAATDAIEALICMDPARAQHILVLAQQAAEELCVSGTVPPIPGRQTPGVLFPAPYARPLHDAGAVPARDTSPDDPIEDPADPQT